MAPGDRVLMAPLTETATVKAIHSRGVPVQFATVGDNVDIGLDGEYVASYAHTHIHLFYMVSLQCVAVPRWRPRLWRQAMCCAILAPPRRRHVVCVRKSSRL